MSLAWPVIASQTTKVEAQKYRPISKFQSSYLAAKLGGKKRKKRLEAQRLTIQFFCFIPPCLGAKCEF